MSRVGHVGHLRSELVVMEGCSLPVSPEPLTGKAKVPPGLPVPFARRFQSELSNLNLAALLMSNEMYGLL